LYTLLKKNKDSCIVLKSLASPDLDFVLILKTESLYSCTLFHRAFSLKTNLVTHRGKKLCFIPTGKKVLIVSLKAGSDEKEDFDMHRLASF